MTQLLAPERPSITITNFSSSRATTYAMFTFQDEREPTLGPHVFPNASSYERPLEFEGKDVVFVSARVHPGETPSSFVMQGILRREPIVIIGKLVSQLNESLFSCTRTLSVSLLDEGRSTRKFLLVKRLTHHGGSLRVETTLIFL